MQKINFNYDNKYDILYLAIADKSFSYCDEDNTGFVISRDMRTEEITGAMIYDFIKKFRKSDLPKLPFCIEVNYEKDILPYIVLN